MPKESHISLKTVHLIIILIVIAGTAVGGFGVLNWRMGQVEKQLEALRHSELSEVAKSTWIEARVKRLEEFHE